MTTAYSGNYPIESRGGEIERLRIQGDAMAPDTEVMLDMNSVFIDHARASASSNTEFLLGDAYSSNLPAESFDFVHMRFVASTAGAPERLLTEAIRLARPGGTIALQEPDGSSLNCFPPHPAWEKLKAALLGAFSGVGADLQLARRLYSVVLQTNLHDVQFSILGVRSIRCRAPHSRCIRLRRFGDKRRDDPHNDRQGKGKELRSLMLTTDKHAPLIALAAAALFGLSTPLAKLLLEGLSPWALASLLYLGSGLGLGVIVLLRRGRGQGEAQLSRADLPWLAGTILFGGVIGPVLLMLGLNATDAASASLLLNLEAVFTLGLAWVIFREHVDARLFMGAAAIVAGAALLSWQGSFGSLKPGTLLIALACLSWAIDNNLTRRISAVDPFVLAAIKGVAAGSVNAALAYAMGAHAPSIAIAASAMALGFVSYGLGLVLFIVALRHLGTARTGAYYGTAPFIGALAATVLLGTPLTPLLVIAGLLMALGAWLHLSERHQHEHRHEAMTHDHRHVHDAHHRHEHSAADPPGEPHSHPHRHAPIRHVHPHWPDLHHRHTH